MTAIPGSSRQIWSIGAITCIEFFETGLVMFSASQIMAGLGLSPGDFALVYTLYGVASIFMLYKHQWMVERLGYRNFAIASLIIFALGSLCCATAQGIGQFALGRILQGAGGATFFTAGRMEINRLPAETRFLGLLAFIGSLLGASAIAPLCAAVLLGLGGWRSIFWATLPLAAAIAWISLPCLSRTTTPAAERSEEHWGWLVWLVLGIFGLQYSIQEIPAETGSAQSRLFLIGLASIVALSIFAWRQWQKDRPLIDYRGLMQWRYLLGLALYFTGYFMIGASGFLLPIIFKEGLGLSLGMTAAVLSFGMVGSVATALLHVAAARRWPYHRFYMLSGLSLFALGCLGFGLSGRLDDWHWLLLPTFFCGIAIPLYIGPVAFGTFSELPSRVFSHGYQVKNIVRQLGISSSVALATASLQGSYSRHLALQPEGLYPEWAQALHGLAGINAGLISPLTLAAADVFIWLAACMLPMAVIIAWQRTFR